MWHLIEDYFEQGLMMKIFIIWGWLCVVIMITSFQTTTDMGWVEFTGLVTGILCVVLLIQRNIWTFPIGLVYAVVSVVVFLEAKLYADVLLSAYYVLMNAYGWYYWLYGGIRQGIRTGTEDLPVRHITLPTGLVLGAITAVGIVAMGWFFDTQTDADLPYWDSATTVGSFAGMWLTARKYLENWIVWFVVDIVASCVYVVKGIEGYAILYFLYLGLAVAGWLAWRQALAATSATRV